MSGKIIVGLAGLPLGDKNAVGWAQTAHGNVLELGGSYQKDVRNLGGGVLFLEEDTRRLLPLMTIWV